MKTLTFKDIKIAYEVVRRLERDRTPNRQQATFKREGERVFVTLNDHEYYVKYSHLDTLNERDIELIPVGSMSIVLPAERI